MKLYITTALVLLFLGAAPLAAATAESSSNPCILYPTTTRVGGYYVYTPGATIPGQSIYFIHTDDVHITRGSVWVPYVTTITTPGICYGPVVDLVEEILAQALA